MTTDTAPPRGRPDHALLEWLDRRGLTYSLREHSPSIRALETAVAAGVDPVAFAKVVAVATDDGRTALLVLDADDYLDLEKAAWALGAHQVRLLSEPELCKVAPGCELGALPAVDPSDRLPILADYALAGLATITFRAGSHCHAVTLDRLAWEHATGARYCSLAETAPVRPELWEWY